MLFFYKNIIEGQWGIITKKKQNIKSFNKDKVYLYVVKMNPIVLVKNTVIF